MNHSFLMRFAQAILPLTLLMNGCKDEIPASSGVKIPISQSQRNDIQLSNLLTCTSYVTLSPSKDCTIRSIHKVIFTNDKIILLDNQTDFRDVWAFDNQGNYLQELSSEGDASTQHKGLNDISAYQNELTLLSAGKRQFLNYSIDTKDISVMANGSIGDMMERADNGNYILYNEHSGTEATENNYLVFFDKKGNLLKREMPYAIEKENVAYGYTGFLLRSGRQIWFNQPFSNTVYEVRAQGEMTPRYELDFGSSNVPADLLNKKIRLPDVENLGFLHEWFVKNGHMIQFEYQLNNRICHGMFDENTGQFCDFRNIAADAYSRLFSRGTVMPKSEEEFILVLRAEQIESLMDDHLVEKNVLNNLSAGLGDAIETAYNQQQPVILSFRYKEGAAIN